MGVVFQIPVGMLALTRVGIVRSPSCARPARYAILVDRGRRDAAAGPDPVTMLSRWCPLSCSTRALSCWRLLDRRAAREEARRRRTLRPTSKPDPMLFDLRGPGRRRTVQVDLPHARLPDGRRPRAVRHRRRRRISGGLVDASPSAAAAATTAPTASSRSDGARRSAGQPAGRRRLGRARARPLPARQRGRQLRPSTSTFTDDGRAELAGRRRRLGAATSRSTRRSPTTASRA